MVCAASECSDDEVLEASAAGALRSVMTDVLWQWTCLSMITSHIRRVRRDEKQKLQRMMKNRNDANRPSYQSNRNTTCEAADLRTDKRTGAPEAKHEMTWHILFSGRFLREWIFSRLWFGTVPVAAVVFVTSLLLLVGVAESPMGDALSRSGVAVLGAVGCYAVGMGFATVGRLGLEIGSDAEQLDETESQKSLSIRDWLVLTLVICMFIGWFFRPMLSYWWGTGSFEQAVTGPVMRMMFLGAYALPIAWSRWRDK